METIESRTRPHKTEEEIVATRRKQYVRKLRAKIADEPIVLPPQSVHVFGRLTSSKSFTTENVQFQDSTMNYKNKTTLYQINFDEIINSTEQVLQSITKNTEYGTLTICNLISNAMHNPLTGIVYSRQAQEAHSIMERVVKGLIESFGKERSLFVTISSLNQSEISDFVAKEDAKPSEKNKLLMKIKSPSQEKGLTYLVLEGTSHKDKGSRHVKCADKILMQDGRTGYLLKSMHDYHKLIGKAMQSLLSSDIKEPSTTLIFQFYAVVEGLKRKYEPFLTFMDLLFSEQKDVVEEVGKFLKNVENKKEEQRMLRKNMYITSLLCRHVLNSSTIFAYCEINPSSINQSVTDLLSFCGLLKRTAILVTGYPYASIPHHRVNKRPTVSIRSNLSFFEGSKSNLTPTKTQLPTIPEKRKAYGIRSKSNKRAHGRNVTLSTIEITDNFANKLSTYEATPRQVPPHVDSDKKKESLLAKLINDSAHKRRFSNLLNVLSEYTEKMEVVKPPCSKTVKRKRNNTVDFKARNVYAVTSGGLFLDKFKPRRQQCENELIEKNENEERSQCAPQPNKKSSNPMLDTKYRLNKVYKISEKDLGKYVTVPKSTIFNIM